MLVGVEGLGEAIGGHLIPLNMEEFYLAHLNGLSDPLVVDIDMFGAFIMALGVG